jgi:hypothetical protein
MAESGQEMITFVEGDPEYYKAIETFLHALPERVEDIQSAFDAQALQEFAAGLSSQRQADAQTSPDYADAVQEVNVIYKELDSMIQMCLVTQMSTDCQSETEL